MQIRVHAFNVAEVFDRSRLLHALSKQDTMKGVNKLDCDTVFSWLYETHANFLGILSGCKYDKNLLQTRQL